MGKRERVNATSKSAVEPTGWDRKLLEATLELRPRSGSAASRALDVSALRAPTEPWLLRTLSELRREGLDRPVARGRARADR